MVEDALSCLRKAAKKVSSIYTQALLAYTFTLSNDTELREMLLTKLDEKAVRKDGQIHWEHKPSSEASDFPSWYQASSAEVELTSYDTVVALEALAKYAEATFTDKGDVTVTVSSKTGFHQQFHVDHTNRLLLQKSSLSDIPGDYSLSASGSGCVYVQTVLRYNIPPPRSDATFSVQVETQPIKCPKDPMKQLCIDIYIQYTGSREKSNMALVEVKLLSGFIPLKNSVKKLVNSNTIKRSEIQSDIVTLYLNELGRDRVHLSFLVVEDIKVKNLKPATVKVYDYYETAEYAVTEYNSPCSSDAETGNVS
ncbi:alpha-2-macroglobulin-like [Xenopus laevis]|uniref:Alpha-2-macroglobulin-like n=1 Tax=Xenopus laevis TaxID=8355 RepID=A0A8J1L8T9_XENLA|nr:alpha-2-macroglobulin-like [Xenopus laevis]